MIRRAARRFQKAMPFISRRDAIKHARAYLDSMVIKDNGRPA